ncbi:DUF3040 domain-containing protein [Arthrobacter ruber]|uniref:DUF3040 domain-containing protein n=1 Tax=Arthrobacter ruber TaxID=1258893 RepID=UPI0012FFD43B|nr:DUF3040 domain-containing protein [Arthrobacter ruber]
MPLSAEERRQWRELERQLTPDVPTVAQPTRDRGIRHRTMGLACSILALGFVLVAFSVVILAVLVKVLLLGVLGFVLMIVGGTRLQHPRRKGQLTKAAAPMSTDVA